MLQVAWGDMNWGKRCQMQKQEEKKKTAGWPIFSSRYLKFSMHDRHDEKLKTTTQQACLPEGVDSSSK